MSYFMQNVSIGILGKMTSIHLMFIVAYLSYESSNFNSCSVKTSALIEKNIHKIHYYAVYLQLSDFTAHPTQIVSSVLVSPPYVATTHNEKYVIQKRFLSKFQGILPYHFQGKIG